MVRSTKYNIIISYHHNSQLQKTTARRLRSLVQRTGDSVYWSKIYDRSKDPTFIFLAILWYALYAWDEALEVLYAHLSEQLVRQYSLDVYVYSDISCRKLPTPQHTLSTRESCTNCKLTCCTISNFFVTFVNRSNSCEIHPTQPWTKTLTEMIP